MVVRMQADLVSGVGNLAPRRPHVFRLVDDGDVDVLGLRVEREASRATVGVAFALEQVLHEVETASRAGSLAPRDAVVVEPERYELRHLRPRQTPRGL